MNFQYNKFFVAQKLTELQKFKDWLCLCMCVSVLSLFKKAPLWVLEHS